MRIQFSEMKPEHRFFLMGSDMVAFDPDRESLLFSDYVVESIDDVLTILYGVGDAMEIHEIQTAELTYAARLGYCLFNGVIPQVKNRDIVDFFIDMKNNHHWHLAMEDDTVFLSKMEDIG